MIFETIQYGLRLALIVAVLNSQVLPAQTIPVTAPDAATDMLIRKARSLEARGRSDLAAQVWHQLLIARPNQPEALAALARWAKHNGKTDEANTYLSRLRKVSPNAQELTEPEPAGPRKSDERLREAAALAASGHPEAAVHIYREAFGPTPPDQWAVAYYETLANTEGGFDPAVAALKRLAATYPDIPEYQLSAAKLLTYRPATRQSGIALLASIPASSAVAARAREIWRQALLWEKTNPAYFQEFQTYLSRYDDPELQTASTALKAHLDVAGPLNSDSREERLGYIALNSGNLKEAERQFLEAVAHSPNSERAHAGLGFVYLKNGEFSVSIEQFEAAQKISSQDAAVRHSLETARFWLAMRQGAKAGDGGDWQEAVSHYQAALALRPNEGDAIRALGGALEAAGSYAQAIPYLTKSVRLKPNDGSSWAALVMSRLKTEGGAAALATMHSVPANLASDLESKVEWRALQALAYADSVDNTRALEIFHQLMAQDRGRLTSDEQIRLAGLALYFHEPALGVAYARKAVDDAPDNAGAWEVLLSSLVESGRVEEAGRSYILMPPKLQTICMSHPSFVETLASLKELSGDLDEAQKLLQLASANSATLSDAERLSMQFHLAQLLAKEGKGKEAETLASAIVERNPTDVQAWRTRLLILQTVGRQDELVSLAATIPPPVLRRLLSQGDIVSLLARAHETAGETERAVTLLDSYVAGIAPKDGIPQRLQLGWLLLNSPAKSERLYALLERLNANSDLTADQRKELATVWTTWILRSAEAFHRAGNETRTLAVLQQGAEMYPDNLDIRRTLAGDLLSYGKTKSALAVYSNWGLKGAQADDYAGAIGAALAQRNSQYADAWINSALSLWPNNPKILELAGESAQSHGDLRKAEDLWKEALKERQAQSNEQTVPGLDPAQTSLESLLVSTHVAGNPNGAFSVTNNPAGDRYRSSYGRSSAQSHEDFVRSAGPLDSLPVGKASYLTNSIAPSTSPVDSLTDKIAAVESRDTPYLSSNISVWGRGGEPGFGRLLIEQTTLEGSKMFTDSWRVSLLFEPTFLSGGTASGTGLTLSGKQTSAASFGPQTAGGVGGEIQLSSDSVGIRLGTTPQGFLLRNWIGGLRIQPKKGPITLTLERDSVKDTLLAYAGARDPQSGQIWGGVMANTGTLEGHWGNDHSGVYASGAYQYLDGRSVISNRAVNAGLGTWWKVATFPGASLTVGMNFSAMHYDHNLRYFTFGQGGYFSPQQYFLFNAPVRWSGVYHHRLQYSLDASLGVQHFVEDPTDYYPSDSALQGATGYHYQALANTGPNFNINGQLNYQLAPHWLLGSFFTASNARNYTAASAGIFTRYTFEERPMSFENAVPSVPNWRGQQPYLVH